MANCYFAKPHGMQHCYIPFLYVVDLKRALNFGEVQLQTGVCKPPKDADEHALRAAAQQVVQDEGYELDVADLLVRR
jgi:hypothetical protein